jgi:hypothetical protein
MLYKNVTQENRLATRRIIRRLSEACDKLPSSIFVTGVSDRDRDPSFGGGFADIYRAAYKGKVVALKRLRDHVEGENARTVRKVRYCSAAGACTLSLD